MIKRNKMIQSTETGATINVVTFEPDDKDNIKGIIQVVHGMTEYIERYTEFAEYFTEKGYVVIGNDIIGHGRNTHKDSKDIHMNDWFNAVSDIKLVCNIATEKYPNKPIFILGFSLGSFLVRSLNDLSDYAGQVLIGTGYQPTFILKLLRLYLRTKYRNKMNIKSDEIKDLAFSNYNNKFKDKPQNYWLLTDEDARKEYENDNLVKRDFTPGFFCEFLTGMIYTNKKLKKPNNTIPTLFIYGSDDIVAGFGKGITKVYKAYYKNNKNTEVYCVDGKTHDVLHDINSELVEELIVSKLI